MTQNGEGVAESGYRLVLTGEGLNIDRSLDAATALTVVELVMGGVPGAAASPAKARQARKSKTKRKAAQGSGDLKRSPRTKGSSPSIVRDLSLRPEGKPSFADFVEEKQPGSHFEKQAVAVYWLAEIAGMQEGITVDYINTCYVGAKWKRPVHFEKNLQLTAARRGWIDTSDGTNIKITVQGQDLVVHDLPSKGDRST